jgi:hypothetical protein
VAAALLRQGEREEAVNWLATAILAGCYPSSVWQGPHRFPQPRQQYYLGSLERSLPHDSLWLITREKLALPVAAAMEPMPHGDDPVLLGFLRFFDAPSIESFDRHLGGLDTPENPNMTANLAIHIAGVLRHHRESAHLVEELRKHARKFD